MSKFDEKVNEMVAKSQSAIITKKDTKFVKTLRIIGTVVVCLSCMLMCIFAAESDGIQNGIKKGLGSVYGVITAIVVPIAVISFAFCAFQIFAGGEKGMEKAKKVALYTVIGVGIVYLAPVIMNQVSGGFKNNGDAGVFN